MGFLQNMADEFGTKTGKAIGNKLFGKYADDLRIGVSPKDEVKLAKASAKAEAKGKIDLAKAEANIRIKEMEAQQRMEKVNSVQSMIDEIQAYQLSMSDIDGNMNFLLQLLSLIESIDGNDANKVELLNCATSKFKLGLDLCKSIDPNNPGVKMLSKQYEEKLQKEKDDNKKAKKTLIIWMAVSIIIVIVFGYLA